MATLTKKSRQIQFSDGSGKRQTIRLGKVSLKQAQANKLKIGDLVSAKLNAVAPSDETLRWVREIGDVLHARLAKHGLVKPRLSATLGDFTRQYIDSRADVKPSTRENMERARKYLLEVFPPGRPLRDFTEGDAERWRQAMIRKGLAENTIRKASGRVRQFFNAAKRDGIVDSNPCNVLPVTVKAVPERQYFVSEAEIVRVIEACPDVEWRLIVALCRYGGLRCPSEVVALKWSDIDWEQNAILVTSRKTERFEGKESRIMPLYAELRPYLEAARAAASKDAVWCIMRYRRPNQNVGTQLKRIIRKAGLEPWPKLLVNLRSTRETELLDQHHPIQCVCAWQGNSEVVAKRHYLQVTDEHHQRAVRGFGAMQNAMQQPSVRCNNGQQWSASTNGEVPKNMGDCGPLPKFDDGCTPEQVPIGGLEPPT